MSSFALTIIFLLYGLSFFSMGLIVYIEGGRGSDNRLRYALRPLAGFGLIHGIHEWLEMFFLLGVLPFQQTAFDLWEGFRVALLAFSFLALSSFGASLLSPTDRMRRLSLMVPLIQSSIWGFGVLLLQNKVPMTREIWDTVDVWSRYVIGIPAALLACFGLVYQQRIFRRDGMLAFGRDSLWAAVAFAWYGLVGQVFTRKSLLFPSTVINQELFSAIFGFPVQLLRASAAMVSAVFVVRFLRSFEVETRQKIATLQAERLEEAKKREQSRGQFLRRIVNAQEAERQRIARELHDETGQSLTAIGLGLRGIATNLPKDAEQAVSNLRQLENMVTRSLDELQRVISDLRPSHLDDLGLAAALRWYAGEVANRVPLSVHVAVEGDAKPISDVVSTALFRIVQEAITNTVKHSQATKADIYLSYMDQDVVVEIVDDGCGFDLNRVSKDGRSAWGLLGMQERASLLGGDLSIQTKPETGTSVKVRIPYH